MWNCRTYLLLKIQRTWLGQQWFCWFWAIFLILADDKFIFHIKFLTCTFRAGLTPSCQTVESLLRTPWPAWKNNLSISPISTFYIFAHVLVKFSKFPHSESECAIFSTNFSALSNVYFRDLAYSIVAKVILPIFSANFYILVNIFWGVSSYLFLAN